MSQRKRKQETLTWTALRKRDQDTIIRDELDRAAEYWRDRYDEWMLYRQMEMGL